jgi:hypothetical protein
MQPDTKLFVAIGRNSKDTILPHFYRDRKEITEIFSQDTQFPDPDFSVPAESKTDSNCYIG